MNIKSVKIVVLLITFVTCSSVCMAQIGSGTADNGISIKSLSVNYAEDNGRGVITTLGTINNSSDTCVDNIVIEVKYFDSSKNLVDVVTQQLYGIVVPAGKEVSFRVRDEADRKKEAYVSNAVRVISSGQITQKQDGNTKSSGWLEVFISWAPMLLLIGVWIVFMRRCYGKASPQQRTLTLVEQQNSILTREVEMLERIASAVEKSSDNKLNT